MNVDQLIDSIISQIKPEWDNLHIIRYVYIELGKVLSRDTDFFFSMEGKLGEANLSLRELREIYESETGRKNFIICKSAALILKRAFDKLGIKSRLIKSLNNVSRISDGKEELEVNHWILAVEDGGNTYFLTLASDLPYIKMGMETHHFGDNISHKKRLNTGELIQVYEGPEINNTVIPRSKLKQIDIDIGYVRFFYSYNDEAKVVSDWQLQYDDVAILLVRDALRNNRFYYDLEIYDTDFYRDLTEYRDDNGNVISLEDRRLDEITDVEWARFIKTACGYVYDKICEILGFEIQVIPRVENKGWKYRPWLISLSFALKEYIVKQLGGEEDNIEMDFDNFNFTKWSRDIKKKYHYDKKEYDYNNLLGILDKLNSLVTCIGEKGRNKDFRRLFDSLSFHFIPRDRVYENAVDENGFVSNYYIANKFSRVFAHVFGCNEEIRDFNKMDYSEQTVILKEILPALFPEINRSNSYIDGYDEAYAPIFNRIQIYPIKKKDNGEYHIVFNVVGDNQSGDYYFLFNPKDNSFGSVDFLDVYDDYYILSDRMKKRINIFDGDEEEKNRTF